MRFGTPSQAGLKATLRHMMILVLWVALLAAASRGLLAIGAFGANVQIACMMVPILCAAYLLPTLAILVRLLDRPGPVRNWYSACCMAAWNVTAGLMFASQDIVCVALTGRPTPIFPLAPFLAVVCLWAGVRRMREVWPRLCPGCGRRSVIPLVVRRARAGNPWRQQKPLGWCATCGAEYERDAAHAWRARVASAPEGIGSRS